MQSEHAVAQWYSFHNDTKAEKPKCETESQKEKRKSGKGGRYSAESDDKCAVGRDDATMQGNSM